MAIICWLLELQSLKSIKLSFQCQFLGKQTISGSVNNQALGVAFCFVLHVLINQLYFILVGSALTPVYIRSNSTTVNGVLPLLVEPESWIPPCPVTLCIVNWESWISLASWTEWFHNVGSSHNCDHSPVPPLLRDPASPYKSSVQFSSGLLCSARLCSLALLPCTAFPYIPVSAGPSSL